MVWNTNLDRDGRAREPDWSNCAVLEQTQEHSRHAAQFSVRLEMKSNELDLCGTATAAAAELCGCLVSSIPSRDSLRQRVQGLVAEVHGK